MKLWNSLDYIFKFNSIKCYIKIQAKVHIKNKISYTQITSIYYVVKINLFGLNKHLQKKTSRLTENKYECLICKSYLSVQSTSTYTNDSDSRNDYVQKANNVTNLCWLVTLLLS